MNKKRNRLLQQVVNGVLLVVAIGLLGWLSAQFKTEFDWTYGHRNTLTAASQRLLKSLPDPIHFYAFVYSDQADQRRNIEEGVQRYRQFKSNVTLQFIDPSREPQKVKEFHITEPGQLVVEYDGRREVLSEPSEPKVSAALERLAATGQSYVVFLQGDGERSINGFDQNGYSDFAQALRDKGLKVEPLNLAQTPKIPDNTSVLVIASPSSQLLPGEEKIIERYVNFGGNLLWLADTDNPPGLPGLAKQLGITWQNGYAVFPNYQMLGTGNPGIYLATNYPPNPITEHLNKITVFPFVRSLTWDKTSGWHYQPLLTTSDNAWLEATQKSGEITFDPKSGDVAGPLTIGLAQTREVTPPPPAAAASTAAVPASGKRSPGKSDPPATAKPAAAQAPKQQRVVSIGDADFLSNGNLKVLGNRDLGVAVINWLAARKSALSINIPQAPDRDLYLPGWATWLITAGYVVILPALLLVFGLGRWIVRRRR